MVDFRILRTNHTGVTVSDIARMSDFFRDVLRCETSDVVEHRGHMVERLTGVPGAEVKIVFVELPGHKIELIEYSRPADKKTSDLRNCDPGAFHIALEVDDIEAAASAAQDHGFTAFSAPQTVPEGPRKGNRNVYLKSPDGIVIEFQMSADRSG